jgi:hypothetical protein
MNLDWIGKFKFPSGFVGKTSLTAAAFLVFCISAMVYLPEAQKFWALPTALVGFILYLAVTHNFSSKNPVLATLEGSSAVAYLRADQAAKNPSIIEGSSTPVPPPAGQMKRVSK